MTETQLNALRAERSKLLDAYRNAETYNKMSILTRIDDIDEQLRLLQVEPLTKELRPRRFFRK